MLKSEQDLEIIEKLPKNGEFFEEEFRVLTVEPKISSLQGCPIRSQKYCLITRLSPGFARTPYFIEEMLSTVNRI